MSAAVQQARTVRRLFEALVQGGLTRLVVSPGSRSTPLVQAAAERQDLQLLAVLDERTAAFCALGMRRAGPGLAGTLCTSGSALAHALPACIEAVESGAALVVISADRPVAVRGLGAPQAIWQPGLLAPYATCVEVDASRDVDAALAGMTAVLAHIALHGGVLHVNVPLDLPLALGPPVVAAAEPQTAPLAGLGLIAELPPALAPPADGERVLLLAGPLPPDAALQHIVAELVAARRVLAVCESVSNLRPSSALRHADALLRDAEVRAALLPDRIVRIGAWPVSKGLQLLLEDARRLAIPVDVVHPRPTDPLQQARHVLPYQAAPILTAWAADATPIPERWRQQWLAAESAAQGVPPGPTDFTEADIVRAIASCLQPGEHLVLGNSMPVRDWETFAPPHAPVAIHVSRGANGIDGTLATACGIALASELPTTVYLGDCTFLHDVGSLQLLASGVPGGLRVVVANNDGGLIFDHLPARAAVTPAIHRRFFTTPHGLDLSGIARSFGLKAVRVRSAEALTLALIPLHPGEVQVIEAVVDAQTSLSAHRAWWQDVSAAAQRQAVPIEVS